MDDRPNDSPIVHRSSIIDDHIQSSITAPPIIDVRSTAAVANAAAMLAGELKVRVRVIPV